MEKIKKIWVPIVKGIVKDANGETVATIEMKPRYKTIPVDLQTYNNIMRLCAARGFGQRAQGTMVRILVNNELTKLKMQIDEVKE